MDKTDMNRWEEQAREIYAQAGHCWHEGQDCSGCIAEIMEALAAAHAAGVAEEREANCTAIRDNCPMCDNGHAYHDPSGETECEYCGRPIAAIRNRT